MNPLRLGLITRIALLVVGVEIVAFGSLGLFAVERYSRTADENLHARLQLVGRMIANDELAISAVARQPLMGELIGAPYLEGLVIGGNGRVIVATNPEHLGRPAAEIPGVDGRWIAATAPDVQFLARGDALTGVMHIHGASPGAPLYVMVATVSTAPVDAEKRAIALWGGAGSLLFILLSSAAIILFAQRLITRRVRASLAILKQVESGNLEARIPVTSHDELGQLQQGINSMTGALGALLEEQRRGAEEMRATSYLLDSIVENIPNMIFLKRAADLRFVLFNKAGEQLLGFDRGELLGKNDYDFFPQEQADFFTAKDRQVLAMPGVLDIADESIRTRGGEERTLHTQKLALRNAAGEPEFLLGISEDITEKKRTTEELQRHRERLELLVAERTLELSAAKEEAEAANRTKSAFLANMSHEIRTPLHAIMGMAHLIRRSGVTPQQRVWLDRIDAAEQHLLEIINNVLDLSKIEAGRLPLEETPVHLDSVVNSVAAMLMAPAEAKNLKLVIEAKELPEHLLGDPTRLKQAILNYGNNAIKFTDSGSVTLRIRVQEESERDVLLRFEVQDTGAGIEPAAAARLFSPFQQGDNSTTRKYGGTGLGLAITKKLAELMGGEVGVTAAPGSGSTFWFTARLRKADAPSRATPVAADAESAEAVLQREFRDRKILLVDDDEDNRDLTLALLKDVWPEIAVATDGVEAVELVGRNRYDLILMDMQMPRMDGIEATRRIRALPNGADVPIIAMTANIFPEDKARCLTAGMNDFFAKAVDANAPFAIILKWLSRAGATAGTV